MTGDWQASALCAQTDPDVFFPDKGGNAPFAVEAAKATCNRCPVAVQCLQAALKGNEKHGIWGGLTVEERATLRRNVA